MTLSSIKSFMLELDGPADAAFTGGEVVSGQVVLELRRDTRVHSMKVQGRGVATAHWLENRGMNSVYNDYTSKITYFRKRQHLIRGLCMVTCTSRKAKALSTHGTVSLPPTFFKESVQETTVLIVFAKLQPSHRYMPQIL